MEWQTTDTLPPPGDRPERVFVVVQGNQCHNGVMWGRKRFGIARTNNDGFHKGDVSEIERQDHMDTGSGVVTHWMRIDLPVPPTS